MIAMKRRSKNCQNINKQQSQYYRNCKIFSALAYTTKQKTAENNKYIRE
jgi:hypothetical protein